MGRPRSGDPRDRRVVLRLTGGESVRLRAAAEAAGAAVSEFARAVLFGAMEVGAVEQAQVDTRRSVTAASTDVDIAPSATGAASSSGASRPAPAEPGFCCPLVPSRCSFVAGSGGAVCPVHGRRVVAR